MSGKGIIDGNLLTSTSTTSPGPQSIVASRLKKFEEPLDSSPTSGGPLKRTKSFRKSSLTSKNTNHAVSTLKENKVVGSGSSMAEENRGVSKSSLEDERNYILGGKDPTALQQVSEEEFLEKDESKPDDVPCEKVMSKSTSGVAEEEDVVSRSKYERMMGELEIERNRLVELEKKVISKSTYGVAEEKDVVSRSKYERLMGELEIERNRSVELEKKLDGKDSIWKKTAQKWKDIVGKIHIFSDTNGEDEELGDPIIPSGNVLESEVKLTDSPTNDDYIKTKRSRNSSPHKNSDCNTFLGCNIKSPPSKAFDIHQQFIGRVKVHHDPVGPTLVTVVNSSRLQSDKDRDMAAAKLSDTETRNIILLRIIPSGDPNKKVVEVKDVNIKLDLAILVDPSGRSIHDCQHNKKQFEKLVEYLRRSKSSMTDNSSLVPIFTQNQSLRGCNFKIPPFQFRDIHEQFVGRIKSDLKRCSLQLTEDPSGPTVVTVANSSSIKKDMAAANLSDTEAANSILLRIISTGDPNKKIRVVKEDNIQLDLAILVDHSGMHVCQHNDKQFEMLVEYLKNEN